MNISRSITSLIFIFLISCNNNNISNSGDPNQVLDKFFTALSKMDMQTARQYATQDSEGMFSLMEYGMKMAPDSLRHKTIDKSRISYDKAIVNGDNASILVKDKVSGENTTFNLKKENGDWKVAFNLNSMMQMGQNKMRQKGMTEEQMKEMMNKVKGDIESNPGLKNLMKDLPSVDSNK